MFGVLVFVLVSINGISCEEQKVSYYETATSGLGASSPRPGRASTSHSCDRIRKVPSLLKKSNNMGLSRFYKKYTEAYKIPIISSGAVPDDALKRACYVVRFLLADNSTIRNAVFKNWGRVGVIGVKEHVTTIPEHSNLDPDYWNFRARGLGGTKEAPISTAPEENILCYESDWYPNQDIMVHELSHGVHLLGAIDALSGWDQKLKDLYFQRQRENDRWIDTYAMSTYLELFAEASQSYFNVNSYSAEPNGREGPINTRDKLREYDPELYNLIKEVFPCGNHLLERCNTTRALENNHVFKTDCPFEPDEFEGDDQEKLCGDEEELCASWGKYCDDDTYGDFMMSSCKLTCGLCEPDGPRCVDKNEHCSAWASPGYHYCHHPEYKAFMDYNCQFSCDNCDELAV